MNKHGKANLLLWGGIALVALLVFGIIKLPSNLGAQSGVPTPANGQPSGSVGTCDSTGLNAFTEYVSVKNGENTSAQYMAPTIQFGSGGSDLSSDGPGAAPSGGSQAITSGATRTMTTWSTAPPCVTGAIYVLSDSSTVGQVYQADTLSKGQSFDIVGQQASRMLLIPYTTTLAVDNDTTAVGASGGFATNINTSSHAIGQGGSVSGYIDAQLQTGSSAFGMKDKGFIVSMHSTDLSSIQASDLSFGAISSGLTVTQLAACPPSVRTYDLGDKCWQVSQFNSQTSTPFRFSYSVKASLANPSSGDVVIAFNDYALVVDNDGKIHQKVYTGSGTDAGVAKSVVRVVVA